MQLEFLNGTLSILPKVARAKGLQSREGRDLLEAWGKSLLNLIAGLDESSERPGLGLVYVFTLRKGHA